VDIVRFSINKPVTVTVGVILVVMFGLIGLGAIPIQLVPTVDRPIIEVQTSWPGRSPEEIVEEITKKQEEQLKTITGLRKMTSISRQGEAQITLEFVLGTNTKLARQDVSDALRQVSDYPDEVDEPRIIDANSDPGSAIAWIIVDLDPAVRDQFPDFDITTLQQPLEDEVKPYLERIKGIAQVNVFGGREREARVLVDPTALAQRGLNHLDVINALEAENRNVSGGTIAEGKRDYRVRVMGQFESPDAILETIIAYRDGRPVFMRDVATAEIGYVKQRGFVRALGQPAIAVNCIRETGSNVMKIMSELRQRLDDVRADILPNLDPVVGKHLRMRQVYDETVYIDSSIGLVTQNLWIGGSIAALVLLFFLRSVVSTGVIVLAIPISVIGTFLALLAFGRTLNVISLAGLAFAVGMVVDNAIVVLENIDRRLRTGEKPREAAWRGGREVWGAILASTLTTIAVFVPILTIREEAGQLFRDIALAIVASVSFSLIVSITVIPAACSRWLRPHEDHTLLTRAWHSLFGLAPIIARTAKVPAILVRSLSTGFRGAVVRPAVIVALTIVSIGGAVLLMPPLDYLPAGNRNLVFGGLLIPPGQSVDHMGEIAERIEARIETYRNVDPGDRAAVATLPPIPRGRPGQENGPPPFDPVPLDNFFIGAFRGTMFIGATSAWPDTVIPVAQLLSNAMNTIPDAYGGAQQRSLFGHGVGGGNTIDVEISGPKLDRVVQAAGAVFGQAGQRFGYTSIRGEPSNFNLEQPEYRVRLNDAGREMGVTTSALGTAVRALFDGAYAGDYRFGSRNIDLMVLPAGGRLHQKEDLASIPVRTPAGRTVPLDTIVRFEPSTAPQEIQRVEEQPAVTIQVTPPGDRPLQQVMNEIQTNIIAPARAQGLIDSSMRVRLEGTAAKLDEVRAALFGASTGAESGSGAVTAVVGAVLIGALVFAGYIALRGSDRRLYGAAGAVGLGLIFATLIYIIGTNPQLIGARFVWALLVTYLLMAALFESFVYPLVIMFSVPLAIIGGFVGLAIVHAISVADPTKAPQQLDVLTMLGFIILIGVVVNNAILIVHQALNFMRGEDGSEPLPPQEAIAESVRTRVRPIAMSMMTTVGGMSPLVFFPGAGSEMYRGLGSVIIGGLICSSFFTLLLVPLLFSLVIDMTGGISAAFAPRPAPETATR